VDDEPSFAELTATHLERRADVNADGYTDPRDAIDELDDAACIVSDFDMPSMTGLELLETVRDRDPDLPFILFTGKGSEQVASDAISKGVTEYLQKSTAASQYDVLANRVQNAIDRYQTGLELERQQSLLDSVVEMTPIGLVVHDETGDVVVANKRARALLSMPTESLGLRAYDTSDWDLYEPDGALVATEDLPVARVLGDCTEIRGERYRIQVGDERREIALNAAPMPDLHEDAIAYAIVGFDRPDAFPS
jgi:FixJ family two-component response regulator